MTRRRSLHARNLHPHLTSILLQPAGRDHLQRVPGGARHGEARQGGGPGGKGGAVLAGWEWHGRNGRGEGCLNACAGIQTMGDQPPAEPYALQAPLPPCLPLTPCSSFASPCPAAAGCHGGQLRGTAAAGGGQDCAPEPCPLPAAAGTRAVFGGKRVGMGAAVTPTWLGLQGVHTQETRQCSMHCRWLCGALVPRLKRKGAPPDSQLTS